LRRDIHNTNKKMATGSGLLVTVLFTNVVSVIFFLFVVEWMIVYVGGQDDKIAYSVGSQPEFSFQQSGRARSKIHDPLCTSPRGACN